MIEKPIIYSQNGVQFRLDTGSIDTLYDGAVDSINAFFNIHGLGIIRPKTPNFDNYKYGKFTLAGIKVIKPELSQDHPEYNRGYIDLRYHNLKKLQPKTTSPDLIIKSIIAYFETKPIGIKENKLKEAQKQQRDLFLKEFTSLEGIVGL